MIAMPVVTIKLYNYFLQWQESINAKFIRNHMLWIIHYVKSFYHFVANAFCVVWLQSLLNRVHSNKHITSNWIGISTSERTVSDVIVFASGRRPLKKFTAHFADMFRLVASTPQISVIFGAKKIFAMQLIFTNIDRFFTKSTVARFASFSLWSFGISITFKRAIFLFLSHMIRNSLTTHNAGYCSDFVTKFTFHDSIIAQSVSTVKE